MVGSVVATAQGAQAAIAQSQPRGLWRDGSGPFGIGGFPEFGKGRFAFNYVSGQIGPISAAGKSAWSMAGALDGGGGPAEDIKRDGDGLIAGPRRLKPAGVRRQSYTVRSSGLNLSAELARPAGAPSNRSVLMVYGSGPAPKEAFDPWALWFLAQGLNVITHDKRGSGNSGGDWRHAGLEDLAGDAKAVLQGARHLGISGTVFAWGASQGGWILPQLAAEGLVDGVILHAGAATTPRTQILDQVTFSLRSYGFDPAEIARAIEYYTLDIDVSCGTRPWTDIEAAYQKASASGVEWILEPPKAADAPDRDVIRLMADFDPTPYWSKCRAPVLAIYGSKDWIVPAETNLPKLRQHLAGRGMFSSIVLPDANHLMFSARTGNLDEYPKLSRLVPGYFSTIETWLNAQA